MDCYLEGVWAVLATFLVAGLINVYLNDRRLLALIPPGPRPLLFLGNVLSIPHDNPWKTYAGWSRMYNSTSRSVLIQIGY